MAIPAFGAAIVEPLYLLTDTAIVGHLGTAQLGALGVAGIVLTSIFAVFNFLSFATAASVARRFGAGEHRKAAEQGAAGIWLGVALGLALGALGLVFSRPIVHLMGAPDVVAPFALTYLRISLLGVPAVLIILSGTGYFRGLQDARTTFFILLASNVANLMLEVAFVYGFHFGIAGSAWGTVIAQIGAALMFLVIARQRAHAAGASLAPRAHEVRSMARVGATFSIRTGSLLAALVFATAIAARLGTDDVAAQQICFQVWLFLALATDSVEAAGQAMIGKLLGSGDPAGARAASRRMMQWALIIGVTFLVVLGATRGVLVNVFTDSAAVRVTATEALLVIALLQPISASVFALDGILVGSGEVRYLAFAMLVATVGVFLPLGSLVLTREGTLTQLWLGLGAWMVARLVGNFWRYRGERWLVSGAVRTA